MSEDEGKIVLPRAAKSLSREHGYSDIKLREAIPYLRAFEDKTIVVKVGGSVFEDRACQRTFLDDVAFMAHIGIRVILVHGGSRQLSEAMKARGMVVRSKDGVRATDKATLRLAMEVFDEINDDLVRRLRKKCEAIGFKSASSTIVHARRRNSDLNDYVGRVHACDTRPFDALKKGAVPVLTCIGVGEEREEFFNINADEVAAGLAGALKAEKFILLTDVDGVRDANQGLISTLTSARAEQLISDGVIRDGMIPKVRVCLDALAAGVKKTHIINGSDRGSLLCEILSDTGIGTEIVGVPSNEQRQSS